MQPTPGTSAAGLATDLHGKGDLRHAMKSKNDGDQDRDGDDSGKRSM